MGTWLVSVVVKRLLVLQNLTVSNRLTITTVIYSQSEGKRHKKPVPADIRGTVPHRYGTGTVCTVFAVTVTVIYNDIYFTMLQLYRPFRNEVL
jgi:hypothetical protein